MELIDSILLAVAAFWLGACPFALWIGKWLAHKDIRNYGDGNPGAFNVFRAAGPKVGTFALIVEIAKGAPLVAVAHLVFNLPVAAVLGIGICAIAGHAFSPLLGLNGGKALAVTLGVLLALPQYDILIVMIIMALIGFLIMESDSWAVMIAPPITLIYLLIAKGPSWEALFIFLVLVIWTVKQLDDLRSFPRIQVKPFTWLRARKATHGSRNYKE